MSDRLQAFRAYRERMNEDLRRLVESLTARAAEGKLVCRHESIVVMKLRF